MRRLRQLITIGYDRGGRLAGQTALLDLPRAAPVTSLPVAAQISYLAGAGLLRLLRSIPTG